ncbi:MAG: hypothetical protein HKO02_03455 [Hyphomonadaceae bacterium]|nr:hypothetical protein [Hyphomonadaceae bacterium]
MTAHKVNGAAIIKIVKVLRFGQCECARGRRNSDKSHEMFRVHTVAAR